MIKIINILKKGLIFLFSNIHCFFLKIIYWHRISSGIIFRLPFSTKIEIQDKGKINFGSNTSILNNSFIASRENGNIKFGKRCFFNRNCQIISHESIELGNDVIIGQNTIILDHDHVILKDAIKKTKFKKSKITIGNNVWIGANCIILKGTTIGDNCVIGAGSFVNGNVPSNSIFYQKRETTIKKI